MRYGGSNEAIFISGLGGDDLGIAGSGASCRPATRDGTAPAAACRQPQPVFVGADNEPAARADAGGLQHQPDGCSARTVAAEPVGSGPPGTGDWRSAQQLYGATLGGVGGYSRAVE